MMSNKRGQEKIRYQSINTIISFSFDYIFSPIIRLNFSCVTAVTSQFHQLSQVQDNFAVECNIKILQFNFPSKVSVTVKGGGGRFVTHLRNC
jgi:hypothetical protein